MAFIEIHNFANLEISEKWDWRIQARLWRKWNQINRFTGDVFGLNLLLVDEFGDRCHVWIGSTALAPLQNKLMEGNVYQIENFSVLPYKTKHRNRCFKNSFHLSFSHMTKVIALNTNNHIPRHVFVPTPLRDLRLHIDQDVYLIDVVGIAERVTPRSYFVDKDGEAKCLVRFRLKNKNEYVKVTFWNECANSFLREMVKATPSPPTIIIASCKVRIFRGLPCVESCAPTRFYLNLDHPCVKQLKEDERTVRVAES